jgi:cation transporter-like permease
MLGIVAASMIYVTTISAKSDSAASTLRAIQGIGITNFILIVIFAYLASYFLESHPAMQPTYIYFMLHGSLFLSLMAVSISALQQI